MNFENSDADDRLRNEIRWINNSEDRVSAITEVISFTSEKNAGKNLASIYTNYRRLDFWKELYQARFSDEGVTFKHEFQEASKKINDRTKTYIRYSRWSKINEFLPKGSYLACSIPNSYWRLIYKNRFEDLVKKWDD